MKAFSKYQLFFKYLDEQDEEELTLTFTSIEAIMGKKLPKSAYKNRTWWSNRSKGALQASAWMNAGYQVTSLDLLNGCVTFHKYHYNHQIQYKTAVILWNANLIRALRLHMGLTQTEFSEKLGVRQQTISEWENNRYMPSRAMSNYLTIIAEQAGFKLKE